MEDWEGFTDKELSRMKKDEQPKKKTNTHIKSANLKNSAPMKKSFPHRNSSEFKEPLTDGQLLSPKVNSKAPSSIVTKEPITDEQHLSPKLSNKVTNPVLKECMVSSEKQSVENSDVTNDTSEPVNKELIKISATENKSDDAKIAESSDTLNNVLNEENPKKSVEKSTVEQYQIQQKLIEDQNKKKRNLLSEAIVLRRKKANQEAKLLTEINKELSQLDLILSADVSLLRDKIEEASIDFMEKQKRFTKAEKEYIESKLAYHRASSHKEKLTEHLYSIIHQNEVRKAKKLTELMGKLELGHNDDEIEATLDLSSVPSINPLTKTFAVIEETSPCHSSKLYSKLNDNLTQPIENSENSEILKSKNINNNSLIINSEKSVDVSDEVVSAPIMPNNLKVEEMNHS